MRECLTGTKKDGLKSAQFLGNIKNKNALILQIKNIAVGWNVECGSNNNCGGGRYK